MSGPLATPGTHPFPSADARKLNRWIEVVRTNFPAKINGEYSVGKNAEGLVEHVIKHEKGQYTMTEIPTPLNSQQHVFYQSLHHLETEDHGEIILEGKMRFYNMHHNDAMGIESANFTISKPEEMEVVYKGTSVKRTVHRPLVRLWSEDLKTTAISENATVPISMVDLKHGELGNWTIPSQVMEHFFDAYSTMPDRSFTKIAHQEYWDSERHENPTDVNIVEKLPI